MNTENPSTPDPPEAPNTGRVATIFVIKLVVLTLMVGFAEGYLHQTGWGGWLQTAVTKAAAGIVALFDPTVHAQDNQIMGSGPILLVTLQCTAVFAKGLFCAAVIAYPCTWRARLVGLVVGLVGVGIVNILRIAGLVLISQWAWGMFEFAHLVLMQGFLISCVAPLWLAWAAWATRRARRSHD